MTIFVKLHQLYLEKIRIRERIEDKYREHIKHIEDDPVYAYMDEERHVLEAQGLLQRIESYIERIFSMSPDLISVLNELVTVNIMMTPKISTALETKME